MSDGKCIALWRIEDAPEPVRRAIAEHLNDDGWVMLLPVEALAGWKTHPYRAELNVPMFAPGWEGYARLASRVDVSCDPHYYPLPDGRALVVGWAP